MSEPVAKLIQSVLQSPHSELVMRRQILELARANLASAGVLAALLESLPSVKDRETRGELMALLATVDTSRFANLPSVHDALMAAFEGETERATRCALLERLALGVHQDARLAAFLIEVLARPGLSDPEREVITRAVARLPAIDEATTALALDRARGGSVAAQASALGVAEHCPVWGERVVAALAPYLEPSFDRTIRLRILKRLTEAKVLTTACFPPLQQMLQNDPDAKARAAALDLLRAIQPWSEDVLEQLLWTASRDADATLRARAVTLQREAPQLSDAQIAALAARLASDRSAGVRIAMIQALKPYARANDVRAAAARAFASHASAFDDAELMALLELLSPYAGRDAVVRQALLGAFTTIASAAQRARLLEVVLPRLRTDEVVPELARLFERERDATVRTTLFALLRPLSITKHPELVTAYVAELVEPGSSFRAECAAILAAAAELHPAIPPALEDVLLHDRDRDLVRTCLEGYLRPRVPRRFEPLLAVVENEACDTSSRQRALDELMRMPLAKEQERRVVDVVAGLKSSALEMRNRS
jgi:hypothetical protein